jgi:Domain of unknown function (DUF6602)
MDRFWTEHLKRLRDSLVAQTDRARVGSDHSVIKGTSIEYVIRRTLSDYMPSDFAIGTGQIANNQNEISPQIDILVFDTNTFPRLAVNEDSSVIVCCESVFEIVEIKCQYDQKLVSKHFKKLIEVESKRHGMFGADGMASGYFVLVVDPMNPDLSKFEDSKRFVGFYSLKGSKSWSSPYKQTKFSAHDGNGLDFFLHHIMSDCMLKGLSELGSLEYTYDTVAKYLGWNVFDPEL